MKDIAQAVKSAFNKWDEIYQTVTLRATELQIEASDSSSFGYFSNNRYFDVNNQKDKVVQYNNFWEMSFYWNGVKEQRCAVLWRNGSSGDARGYSESAQNRLIGNSEISKTLFDNGKIKITIERREVLPPTESIWAYRFGRPVFVLYVNGVEKCFDKERWLFEKKCLNRVKPKTPKTLFEKLKFENSPFRLLIVNSRDTERIKELSEKLDFAIDKPFKYDYFDSYKDKANVWVVFILGLKGFGKESYRKRNATWFLVDSLKKPTNDYCLEVLFKTLKIYEHDSFIEYLIQCQNNGINLNRLNLLSEERIYNMMNGKFKENIKSILNVSKL